MSTGSKIYEYRRKCGMTQEELADKLGVSRQAVSKWESDAAFPETENILELCKLFGISSDELLFGKQPEAEELGCSEGEERTEEADGTAFREPPRTGEKGNGKWELGKNGFPMHYEYVSETKVFGIPLVHVNIGFGHYRAKGIVAVGNVATGVVSLGLVSLGVVSMGLIALGILAFGTFAVGLILAAAAIAVGALSFGGIAVGVLSFGGLSVGYFAVGGCSVGRYAIGDWARGWVAVGKTRVFGEHTFLVTTDYEALCAFLEENVSKLAANIVKAFAAALS